MHVWFVCYIHSQHIGLQGRGETERTGCIISKLSENCHKLVVERIGCIIEERIGLERTGCIVIRGEGLYKKSAGEEEIPLNNFARSPNQTTVFV